METREEPLGRGGSQRSIFGSRSCAWLPVELATKEKDSRSAEAGSVWGEDRVPGRSKAYANAE